VRYVSTTTLRVAPTNKYFVFQQPFLVFKGNIAI